MQVVVTCNRCNHVPSMLAPHLKPARLLCRKSTFQDSKKLYLLLEYVPGGELFKHLRKAGKFSLGQARFYAASIFLVFDKLHQQDYVYR